MKNRTLALLVFIATIVFAVSPVIFPGFSGYNADQFPIPQDDPPVQPEGWAFSIWGLIYLWLIVGAGFGLLRRADDDGWAAMRPPLLISLAIGFLWIPTAQYLPGVATLMILVMLVTALIAMLRSGYRDPWWEGRPVALYAGWLTAASGVSVGIWLAGHGVLSQQVAAILCLIGVCGTALFIQSRRPEEWAYPLAIIWGLTGIIAANLSSANWVIVLLAGLGALLLAARAVMARRQIA